MPEHTPAPLRNFADGSFARNCNCGWLGTLWSAPVAADRDYLMHVLRDQAAALGRRVAVIEFVDEDSGELSEAVR